MELHGSTVPVAGLDVGSESLELAKTLRSEVVHEVNGNSFGSPARNIAELSLSILSCRLHLDIQELVANLLVGATT